MAAGGIRQTMLQQLHNNTEYALAVLMRIMIRYDACHDKTEINSIICRRNSDVELEDKAIV